jgi:hypothetical protein
VFLELRFHTWGYCHCQWDQRGHWPSAFCIASACRLSALRSNIITVNYHKKRPVIDFLLQLPSIKPSGLSWFGFHSETTNSHATFQKALKMRWTYFCVSGAHYTFSPASRTQISRRETDSFSGRWAHCNATPRYEDLRPCPKWDSNPRLQCSGSPTLLALRALGLLGPVFVLRKCGRFHEHEPEPKQRDQQVPCSRAVR